MCVEIMQELLYVHGNPAGDALCAIKWAKMWRWLLYICFYHETAGLYFLHITNAQKEHEACHKNRAAPTVF
jgi:hypothetical protein